MKVQSVAAKAAAAMALSSLHGRDPELLEQKFRHLTKSNLSSLDKSLSIEMEQLIEQTGLPSSSFSSLSLGIKSSKDNSNNNDNEENSKIYDPNEDCRIFLYDAMAEAVIRYTVYGCLSKYSKLDTSTTPSVIEEALKYHTLPESLQRELNLRYGKRANTSKKNHPRTEEKEEEEQQQQQDDEGSKKKRSSSYPQTWFDALEQLKEFCSTIDCANADDDQQLLLWHHLMDHPMTSYVPMQCQHCGHIVPDDFNHSNDDGDEDDDARIGLSEQDPIGTELQIRGGWFRGKPRKAKLLVLDCPKCSKVSTRYRSGHPQIILNPYRWGRLCGEQEELRLQLAQYLHIPIRTCIPIDWDHIWHEYQIQQVQYPTDNNVSNHNMINNNDDQKSEEKISKWTVHDDNDRNFAVRLDEGIGCWTYIWTIHPNPNLCQDVSDEYLACQSERLTVSSSTTTRWSGRKQRQYTQDRNDDDNYDDSYDYDGTPSNVVSDVAYGRADDRHCDQMTKKNYRGRILYCRKDSTGTSTQAKTLYGYVIHRANWTSHDITQSLRQAAKDYYCYCSHQDDSNEELLKNNDTNDNERRGWWELP